MFIRMLSRMRNVSAIFTREGAVSLAFMSCEPSLIYLDNTVTIHVTMDNSEQL